MKILFRGVAPIPTPNWWTDLHMTCGTCETLIRLESDDKVIADPLNGPAGKGVIRVTCPVCGEAIEDREPKMREQARILAANRKVSP